MPRYSLHLWIGSAEDLDETPGTNRIPSGHTFATEGEANAALIGAELALLGHNPFDCYWHLCVVREGDPAPTFAETFPDFYDSLETDPLMCKDCDSAPAAGGSNYCPRCGRGGV